MGEHGPHVNWKFLGKIPWTRCPMGINKGKMSHYLSLFNTNFGYIFLYSPILFLLCNKILLDLCFAHVVSFFFLVSWSKFVIWHALFFVFVRKSYNFDYLRAHDTLDISNRNYSSLINNGLILINIHVNVIFRDEITQEYHFRLMEFTLFQFVIKSNFLKLFQIQMYMALIVLHVFWKNEDDINVIDHKIIQIFTKDIIH
jgi:hypothetical protein